MKVIKCEGLEIGEKNFSVLWGILGIGGAGYFYSKAGEGFSSKVDQIGGTSTCSVAPQECSSYTCHGGGIGC